MTNQTIADDLLATFGEGKIIGFEEHSGILNAYVAVEDIRPVLQHLFQKQFQFLTDLVGVHYPENLGGELGVVYHLHNWTANVRCMVRSFVPVAQPDVPTVSDLFKAANWMEREAFDFYGINFTGHPNLLRILNIEEMDYHPMRKEYALEDATREDKIDALFGR